VDLTVRSEAGEPPRRQDVFREGEAGRAQPVEYAQGVAGDAVGGEMNPRLHLPHFRKSENGGENSQFLP